MMAADTRPLILHIVHRFDFGGLENGLVNLVNHLPTDEFRHHILALTDVSTIAERICTDNVEVTALGKRAGKDFGAYWRLLKLVRRLRPVVVHTRNIGTLDCQFISWLARVPVRVHGEHGWDVDDPDGTNVSYQRRRRAFFRLVHRIVPLSQHLESYLLGVQASLAAKITRICNGVDLARFPLPANGIVAENPASPHPAEPASGEPLTFGSVTRFSEIKAPLDTIRAFARARQTSPAKLIMVGDGPLLADGRRLAEELGVADDIEFAGAQLDVVPWFERFDVFVLSSLREGISNTVLEAMAASLPVVASGVGGNLELVKAGETGALVEPGQPDMLAEAMTTYLREANLALTHGRQARTRAEELYALPVMVEAYRQMYWATIEAVSGRA